MRIYNIYLKFLILFLFIISGCVENKATGDRQLVILSQDEENNIGAQEHPKIIKAFGGIYDDIDLQNYINSIGYKLASKSELPNIRWTFTILDNPLVNAFALPGGYIYLTRGLLSLANDESEVASVIGHEIAHVTARHTAERHAKATFSNLGLEILDIIVGQPIITNLANLGLHGVLSSFSRSQELEADKLGIRYIKKSNYDSEGSVRFLARLDALSKISPESDKNFINSIFATHPKTIDRIEYTKSLAKSSGKDSFRDIYLMAINNMIYGDSSKHGVIKNNKFLHLDLDFSFSVPKGYFIINKNESVTSHNENKNVVVIFDGMLNQELISMRELIEANIGRSRVNNYQEFLINGRMAISIEDKLLVNYNGKKYYRKIILIKWSGSRIWRFSLLIVPNLLNKHISEAEGIAKSFSALNDEDKNLAEPKYIKIINVQPGDTIESLSNQMAVVKNKKELFCILNGINCQGEQTKIQNGILVKMIVD
tara:strand:+ start:9625 stop:11076 length:1452 start_codon:yes stop_codon:yes gene_type:complete